MSTRHPVPAEALAKHIAILGKTGSGKSNLAKTIAEDLLARGERVCVIDPTGTWWGLRLMADGDTPSGHPIVIFGGQHADLPIGAAHGAAIARAIGTSSTPAIIDTRDLTVSDRTRFFTGFAETLVRANRGELTLILDEAHLFMLQSGARVGGGAPAMLHAGNNLVSLGRGVGLSIVLISQRPAKLHKDSLTQVETLVAMRLIAPQDRNAIDDWIGEWADAQDGRELARSLPSLPTGDAWIWSPEMDHLERAHCPLAATYDSGHARTRESTDLPAIDVAEIAARLEEVGAEVLADDPKALRRRIAVLERELRKKAPAAVDEAELERRVGAALVPVHEDYARRLSKADRAISGLAGEVRALAGKLEEARTSFADLPAPPKPRRPRPEPRPLWAPAPSGGLTGPQQRVLDALAWLEGMGIAEPASRVQAAFLAGYKPGGGAFNNTLGSLRSAGLIEYPSSGEIALTDGGRMRAREADMPLTTEALQHAVMNRLSGPQRRVLQPVIAAWPDEMSVEELADAAGYEAGGGAFNNTRGSLRSLGLIEYPAPGMVVARPVLFVSEDGYRRCKPVGMDGSDLGLVAASQQQHSHR